MSQSHSFPLARREFLAGSLSALAGTFSAAQDPAAGMEPIIDIHQHTDYHGRPNDVMLRHQRAMGVTTSILLPAGT